LSKKEGINGMEETFDVKPVGVKYICDKCGKGEMLPTGRNDWSANPPLLEHECNYCGTKMKFHEKYPLIRYQTITE
jgi:DNA-directed RNA polymerase subunit RPC12/RpoP